MTKEEREKEVATAIEMFEYQIERSKDVKCRKCDECGANPFEDYCIKDVAKWLSLALEALKQEPCEDAVSRKPIIDELNRLGRNAFKDDTDYDNFFAFVDSLPSVTPKLSECEDAISRKAVITIIQNHWWNCRDIDKLVNEIPSVTPTNKPKWIPVSSGNLPKCEQKVMVLALYRNSTYVITTGMYEDGSVSECDSVWRWEDMDFEKWDDENDCGIIPEGWFEYHEYNPDGVLNYAIEDKVVAWMPLPEPYKEGEQKHG